MIAEELKAEVDKAKNPKLEFPYVQILNTVERLCMIGEQTAKDYIKQMMRQGIIIGHRGNRIFTLKEGLTDEQIQRMKES